MDKEIDLPKEIETEVVENLKEIYQLVCCVVNKSTNKRVQHNIQKILNALKIENQLKMD